MRWLGCENPFINVCIAVRLEACYQRYILEIRPIHKPIHKRADFAKLCLLEFFHEALHVEAEQMQDRELVTLMFGTMDLTHGGKPN